MTANPILLQRKYTRIIVLLAERLNITLSQALEYFIFSKTYELMQEGIGDIHCLSDGYLVDELINELQICNSTILEK